MSDGTTATRTVVFCDLDGTLVLDNSFHGCLATAWTLANARQRLALSICLLPRLLGRLAGGHAGLKRRALNWIARQPEEWRADLVKATMERLDSTVSTPIRRDLQTLASGGADIVLATAAPDFYARPFAARFGMIDCLATASTVTQGWSELLGTRKADACATWLAKRGVAPRVVVMTDHADDVPLLRLADEAIIQASPTEFDGIRSRLDPARPVLRHVDPLADEEGGGHWLWFDDRPRGPLDAWEVHTILSKHRHARIYSGAGQWRRIGPGQTLDHATLRRDCPRPPGSRDRLMIHLRRRIQRDWLGTFH